MGFASAYLEERALFPRFIGEPPGKDTGIIIVVPAYDEPGIERMLDSVAACSPPPCGVELIVVINAPGDATPQSRENNLECIENIKAWKNANSAAPFRLFFFQVEADRLPGWGVGLARKTGMDEAVRRFDDLNAGNGIILCLDADCTVREDYLSAVYNDFFLRKNRNGCSIYFEHPLSGGEFPGTVYEYITLYELHLRYYLQALVYTGFPYAFHTVGSCTAVRALSYVKAGGMNRRQAGEDFYFIQKLLPLGGYFALNSTVVYPSPRLSFRVPFGTGASVTRMTDGRTQAYMTYDPAAFGDLKLFFSLAAGLPGADRETIMKFINRIPQSVTSFISEEDLYLKLEEITGNTSTTASFMKRFFSWFNMFMIVRFLNTVHSRQYARLPVADCASEMLKLNGTEPGKTDPLSLLRYYRDLERGA